MILTARRPRPGDYIDALVCGLPEHERGGRWLMILQAYIDDSGSHDDGPVYVLGGLISTVDRWKAFTADWHGALSKEPPLTYFKMSEAMSRRGQFAKGWSVGLRDQRVMELASVVARHSMATVSCAVSRADFDEFIRANSPAPEFRDPYFLCFYKIVLAANAYASDIDCEPCDFIFDEQGIVGKNAVLWWDLFKHLHTETAPCLVGSPPIFRSDQKFLPLQSADMYAWLERARLERIESRSNTDPILELAALKAMKQNVVGIPRVWSRPSLMELGALIKKGMPS